MVIKLKWLDVMWFMTLRMTLSKWKGRKIFQMLRYSLVEIKSYSDCCVRKVWVGRCEWNAGECGRKICRDSIVANWICLFEWSHSEWLHGHCRDGYMLFFLFSASFLQLYYVSLLHPHSFLQSLCQSGAIKVPLTTFSNSPSNSFGQWEHEK